MDQSETAVEFPVVLYNGERQVNIGTIEIHPTIDFQKFRTMLKQIIGISYNNLTTYLVESRRPEHNNIPSDRRKILITSKVDFMVLTRDKNINAYFLVVLKRSRRDRRRKNNHRNCVDLSPADLFDYRFDHHHETETETVTTHANESSKVEYWFHELEMERENNNNNNNKFMTGDLNDANFGYNDAHFPSINEAYLTVERRESRVSCGECTRANKQGVKPVFHLCVYDDVVEGFFRSTAGPICRPG